LPGTGFAVGSCAWVEVVRGGLGDGFEFSVTVGGEDGGPAGGLAVVVERDGWVVTVLPGVVTSEEADVVVVVVLVWTLSG
jgi:hypothetical protein